MYVVVLRTYECVSVPKFTYRLTARIDSRIGNIELKGIINKSQMI